MPFEEQGSGTTSQALPKRQRDDDDSRARIGQWGEDGHIAESESEDLRRELEGDQGESLSRQVDPPSMSSLWGQFGGLDSVGGKREAAVVLTRSKHTIVNFSADPLPLFNFLNQCSRKADRDEDEILADWHIDECDGWMDGEARRSVEGEDLASTSDVMMSESSPQSMSVRLPMVTERA
ncbi:hypothetical protein BLNAU_17785 [Blattamonas nauphoetae]|uniref:Uncharacterized protein n=1 Tax=Blattamonas nauphoetae TaxID=2049346 RepID=A0ABQ9X6B1_9EUKA|nr:hypothetical protein BLNAU_17785 [Blattamonas nauphoetae]